MRHTNGQISQTGRLVKETACFGSKYLYFESVVRAIGPTYDRSTSGGQTRQTGRLCVGYPLIVSSIDWDVRIADDYICRFVTAPDGTTSAFDVNTAVTVAAPGTVTITPTNGDFMITPGIYYLQLATHDAASVNWWDKNASYTDYTYYLSADLYYTTTRYDYTIPARINARVGVLPNMVNFSR